MTSTATTSLATVILVAAFHLFSGRTALASQDARLVPDSPSVVHVDGWRLIVQRRLPDETLAPAAPYVINGVFYSPASKKTSTGPADPDNAAARRPEFCAWMDIDIPLLAEMNTNTIRLAIDPGLDSEPETCGLRLLDELYRNGIMVVMTVDDGVSDTDRIERAVTFYRDHPAILMWSLGSEVNINGYFGRAQSPAETIELTRVAAALIKSLDSEHPVVLSYGEIDINAPGLRLEDTKRYVEELADVDVWSLNIYRGRNFGSLFVDWASVSSKPMFLGEFGTDAFRSKNKGPCPSGVVDELAQASWARTLWNDLVPNISTLDAGSGIALGGTVFSWVDEYWKVPPSGSQQTCGFSLGGHPDGFANEEYFGIVDIKRGKRVVFDVLRDVFASPLTQRLQEMTVRAISAGAHDGSLGLAEVLKDDSSFYRRTGGAGGGRGFNLATVIPETGQLWDRVRNFDTWGTRGTGSEMEELLDYIEAIPDGMLVLVAIGDEAGLTFDNSCEPLPFPWVEASMQAMEDLGSLDIRDYCFRDSWAMVTFKGTGVVLDEALSRVESAAVETDVLVGTPDVCSSMITDVPSLRSEIDALGSNENTRRVLHRALDRAEAALGAANQKRARILLMRFAQKVWSRASQRSRRPTWIPRRQANELACSAANLIHGLPLDAPPAPSACSSSVVTVGGLKSEVESMSLSRGTGRRLVRALDRVEKSLGGEKSSKARRFLENFVVTAVLLSHKRGLNALPPHDANLLVCGGVNLLHGIPAP